MIPLLCAIIALLLLIIVYQYRSKMKRDRDLAYIQEKLKMIINEHSREKLLIQTDDKMLKSILIVINELLDYSHKTMANYMRTENSMKKMLSNVSHDLKTPLTVILGYVETLIHDEHLTDDEKQILLERVKSKTDELLNLINKFFDLAKLEAGDRHITLTRIQMNEVCRKNILAFYDILTNKGFDVRINIPENPLFARGNEEAVDRILGNLLSNAIKYGYEGQVIGLDLNADEQFIYVAIWDRGKGISELNKERVFERLYTLEDSRNQLYQGSGLGLTITKRLVEKMGGEITLKSKPYEKTVFSFKLQRLNY
ncbi:sensor histidine kinase [Vallitalea okinawensis]|uniref:sensor histidine kinase n=1 Tax=Vallitalea okinawensis TaxID=2078660 RepID=UPI000CFC8C3B|nr:sensor histidine kinase [Vallitalea okinawensis]